MLCTGKLVIYEGQTRIAPGGIAPHRNGFVSVAKLHERFAFLLARQNQVVAFCQSVIQPSLCLVVTSEPIQNSAALIETQSLRLSFLISRGPVEQLNGL